MLSPKEERHRGDSYNPQNPNRNPQNAPNCHIEAAHFYYHICHWPPFKAILLYAASHPYALLPFPHIVGKPVRLMPLWPNLHEAWVQVSTISRFWCIPPSTIISENPENRKIARLPLGRLGDTPGSGLVWFRPHTNFYWWCSVWNIG